MKRNFICWFLLVGLLSFCSVGQSSHAATTSTTAADNQRLEIPETDNGLPGAGPIRRYDWFKKLWLERRTAWAGRVQQDQNALVFLGDSITQGCFFSGRRRHTSCSRDWSSDVCSSDLAVPTPSFRPPCSLPGWPPEAALPPRCTTTSTGPRPMWLGAPPPA